MAGRPQQDAGAFRFCYFTATAFAEGTAWTGLGCWPAFMPSSCRNAFHDKNALVTVPSSNVTMSPSVSSFPVSVHRPMPVEWMVSLVCFSDIAESPGERILIDAVV